MDRYTSPVKFMQYQLWQDCRNGCKFCSEKCQLKVDRKKSLEFIINKLDDKEILNYKEVGIIGGEIFDNQLEDKEVLDLLYKFTEKVSKMHFVKFYVATNLIYNMNTYLIPYLEYCKKVGLFDKLLLCTSYDIKYRFNKEGKKELWESNMLELYKLYPTIHLHIETILSQFFIDAVLNKEFDIEEFNNKFHTRVDYIEPTSGMFYNNKLECSKDIPDLFPTKKSYIKFLYEYGVKRNVIDLTCMMSYQLRASRVYHLDCGKFVCYEDRRQPGYHVQCSDTSKKYEIGLIDSNESMENIAINLCKMLDKE